MADFLLELLCEEIPARMQGGAAEQLKKLATDWLGEQGLKHDTVTTYVSPRRLALIIEGLPLASDAKEEERRGPRVDAPAKALDGFLRSTGLNQEQLEQRDTGKGVFYFAVTKIEGQPTSTLLQTLPAEILAKFKWQKSMRWGSGAFKWVRPLQAILAMFDGEALQGGVDVSSDKGPRWTDTSETTQCYPYTNRTVGHRVMSDGDIEINNAIEYVPILRQHKVLVDAAERRTLIMNNSKSCAEVAGDASILNTMLEEVTGLSEWPVPLLGTIDQEFVEELPAHLLRLTMEYHQKYFPVYEKGSDTQLAPYFVAVADLEAPDGGKAIIAGNERVLRARLHDALFMYRQDLATPLADFNAKLSRMVFHKKLGTVAERVGRFGKIAPTMYRLLPESYPASSINEQHIRWAAANMKADLVSGVVGEFPELQGIMGGLYAAKALAETHIDLSTKEANILGNAIAQHYLPAGPSDPLPVDSIGRALALADKLDALLCFFAIEEKPTGSRDPFALRRAAYGVIRIMVESEATADIQELLNKAWCHDAFTKDAAAVIAEVESFINSRVSQYLKDQEIPHGVIQSLMDEEGKPLYPLAQQVLMAKALTSLLSDEPGKMQEIVEASQRCSNIVAASHADIDSENIDPALFTESAEQKLFDAVNLVGNLVAQIQNDTLQNCRTNVLHLHSLVSPINHYFATVLVNDANIAVRNNRLALINYAKKTSETIAKFNNFLV